MATHTVKNKFDSLAGPNSSFQFTGVDEASEPREFVSPLSLSLRHALTAAGVLSPSQLDPYPSFGPQSETGERLNRMAGDRAELESLGNGGEYECGLHHRERGSDTLPRSGPERKVGEPRQVPGRLRVPAVRIEFGGQGEEPGVPMPDPRTHHDVRTRGNVVAGKF